MNTHSARSAWADPARSAWPELARKEFRLNLSPWLTLFWLFGALLLIPAWPYFIAFAYLFMFFMVVSQTDKANRDLEFTVLLPVPRSGIVTARTCTAVIAELSTLALGVPFAIAHHAIYSHDNQAGMNPNLAFFGLMLVMYATFNLVYLPGSYQAPYRMLWPILGGSLLALAVGGTLTTAVAVVPALAERFNHRGLGQGGWQTLLLALGAVVFGAFTWLAHRRAVAHLNAIDL